MKRAMTLGLLIFAALPACVGAQEVTTGTKGGKPYFETSDEFTRQATVLAVDAKSRIVTLKTEAGDTTEVVAGDAVKNFAQIRVNDVVKITYRQKLTVHVEAPGDLDVTTEEMTESAKPGEKPKGSVMERTSYKAMIAAIDKKKGTATLKDYKGREFSITPLHPENLDKVSVGETVVFTYTESVAASVERLPAKPAAKAETKK